MAKKKLVTANGAEPEVVIEKPESRLKSCLLYTSPSPRD